MINFNNKFESLNLSVLFEQLKQIIYDYNCNNKFFLEIFVSITNPWYNQIKLSLHSYDIYIGRVI